jgi:hypothetical protein
MLLRNLSGGNEENRGNPFNTVDVSTVILNGHLLQTSEYVPMFYEQLPGSLLIPKIWFGVEEILKG